MKFKILLWFAKTFGWWRYDGLLDSPRTDWIPKARVYYPDIGKYSIVMPIGNAVEYAQRNKGIVTE